MSFVGAAVLCTKTGSVSRPNVRETGPMLRRNLAIGPRGYSGSRTLGVKRRPVAVSAILCGLFRFAPADGPGSFGICFRSFPELHRQALREALSAL